MPADRPSNTDFARTLRRNTTPPEAVLWKHLRARRLGGWKFRRQQPIGPFVADFYCADAKLVVEIDSRAHNGRLDRDAARDKWMASDGIETLRVTASDITKNLDGVLQGIAHVVRRRLEQLRDKE
ncbi:MAG: endonuclease domain-containing protein [Phycisphaerales bacterium]